MKAKLQMKWHVVGVVIDWDEESGWWVMEGEHRAKVLEGLLIQALLGWQDSAHLPPVEQARRAVLDVFPEAEDTVYEGAEEDYRDE